MPTVSAMAQLLAPKARAYVYSGMWVADCPRACGNVEPLFDRSNPRDPNSPRTLRRASFHCTYCHQLADIEWSPNEAEIMEVLERRPVPHNRNWYPAEHETAIKFRIAHGQSVQDLRDENAEHGVQ